MTQAPAGGAPRAAQIVAGLAERGLWLAVAESLTGGMVLATLTSVPGASLSIRGGVVAYDVAVKAGVLGVDEDLLARSGPVDPQVAGQMARGVRLLLGADLGLATTGEAGPSSATGKPVGLFHVALDMASGSTQASARAEGERQDVRRAAVAAALDLVWSALSGPDVRSALN